MNTNDQGVVLDGYDVVSYFTEDRAVRGNAEHTVEHNGAKFYFSNRENRELFRTAPESYVPQFEGYCAFGVAAHKMRVPSDPRTFKIYNGGLLLFFNDLHEGTPVNTKVMWNANEQQLYADASGTWPTI
jgi:YHS domain-containing protein